MDIVIFEVLDTVNRQHVNGTIHILSVALLSEKMKAQGEKI